MSDPRRTRSRNWSHRHQGKYTWQIHMVIDASTLATIVEAARGGENQGQEKLADALIRATGRRARDGENELKEEENILFDKKEFIRRGEKRQ